MVEWYDRMEKNICDTVKEWEIKIGFRAVGMELYYPEESLVELMGVEGERLSEAIEGFLKRVQRRLGDVEIFETKEKGRYCVRIPAKGVGYVHECVAEPVFLRAFLEVITEKGKRLEDVETVFLRFSERVFVRKTEEREWGFWFEEDGIDPYVYHVEEDDFGLEYHRFTKDAYRRLFP